MHKHDADMKELLAKFSKLASIGDKAEAVLASTVSRSEELAAREGAARKREKLLGEREAAIAEREATLARQAAEIQSAASQRDGILEAAARDAQALVNAVNEESSGLRDRYEQALRDVAAARADAEGLRFELDALKARNGQLEAEARQQAHLARQAMAAEAAPAEASPQPDSFRSLAPPPATPMHSLGRVTSLGSNKPSFPSTPLAGTPSRAGQPGAPPSRNELSAAAARRHLVRIEDLERASPALDVLERLSAANSRTALSTKTPTGGQALFAAQK